MSWLHAVIDVPTAQLAATVRFWESACGWPLGAPWLDHPELRSFEPEHGRPYLHVQEVEGSPRVHLDVEADVVDTTVGRVVDLGAVLVDRQDRWQVLESPGHLPFCVLAAGAPRSTGCRLVARGSSLSTGPGLCRLPRRGSRGQVAPGGAGSSWEVGASPQLGEFAGKWHDDAGAPLQLLFQRLDEDPSGPVRAHLDVGTDDLQREVERLIGLGAIDVGPGRGGWHVLVDPAGLRFCVTENSPERTRPRDIG